MVPEEKLRRLKILSTGSAVPERVLTNFDLEKIVDTSDEWIQARTGIRERRIADEDTATSDLVIEAARIAMEDAGLGPKDLDAIIVGTVTPDMLFPSTACFVQKGLGINQIPAFDVSAACSGFLYGLAIADGLIANRTYEVILLAGAETLSKILDWTDRSTCVLFGDGAGASVVAASENEAGLLSMHLGADGSLGDLLKQPGGGSRFPASHETIENRLHYVKMKGNDVFKYAVRAMEDSALKALRQAGLTSGDVDILIPHQANLRIIKATAKRLGIPMDKVYVNIDRYGNISAGSIPIALDEACRTGRVREGDIVLLDAFGGGFTWGAAVVRW